MHKEDIEDLVCPGCRTALTLEKRGAIDDNAVGDGFLRCPSCEKEYRIIDGIPFFATELGLQQHTAKAYEFQWKAFWKGLFDRGDVFGLMDGLLPCLHRRAVTFSMCCRFKDWLTHPASPRIIRGRWGVFCMVTGRLDHKRLFRFW